MSCAGYVIVSTEDCTKIVEVTTTQVVNVITEGPAGPTGVISVSAPLSYDSGARSLSISLSTVATTGAYSDLSGRPSLGTAASQNVGTSAGNVVQLDGSARLPAVDGSQLTGIVTTTNLGYTASTRALTSSTGTGVTLPEVNSTDPGLMSSSDKTKLDGVQAGAEANVNADWNAVSGDAQILNKPTLGTAAAADTGTSAGNVVQLDGSARLPAVDGSQLTGIVTTTNLGYTASTRALTSSTGTGVTLPLFDTASTDAGLVPGSSTGSTTQFLRADGTWATPTGGTDALVDATTTSGTIYVGRATIGTSPSTAAWTIVKSTFSAAGVRLTKGTATSVAWTNRTTATYT